MAIVEHARKFHHTAGRGSNLFTIPLMLYLISVPLFSRMPFGADVSQLLGVGAAGAFAGYVLLTRGTIKLPSELILFGGFIVYSFFGGFIAVNSSTFVTRQFTLVQLWILAFVMFNALTAEPSGHERALRVVQISVILTGLVALLGYDDENARLAGTLGNPNIYGLTMLLGIAATLLISTRSWIGHLVQIGAIAFLTLQVMLSGSRKAVLGALLILVIHGVQLLARNVKRPVRVFGLTLILAVVSVGVITWAQNTPYWHRVENLLLFLQGESVSERSVYTRFDMMIVGLELWRENPLFGVGTDQFRFHAHRYGIRETYSHSNPIEVLANFGLIGASLYYGTYFALTWRIVSTLRRRWRSPDSRHLFFFLAGFWLVWVALESAWVTYYSKTHWIAFVLVMAVAYNHSRRAMR